MKNVPILVLKSAASSFIFIANLTKDMPNLPPDHQSQNYREKAYPSGVRLHGGRFTARKNARHSRWHAPYSAFILLKEGELSFELGAQRYCIGAPAALYIRQSRPTLFTRHVKAGQPVEKYTLSHIQQWLADSPYPDGVHLFAPDANLWAQAARLHLAPTCGAALLSEEAAVMQLLAGLWHCLLEQNPPPDTAAAPAEFDAALDHALDMAYQQGARSAAALADAVHLSPRSLNRRLQQQYRLSAADWLKHKKMSQAAALLAAGRSIGETAYACGYCHPSSFVQTFHRYYGITPKQYQTQ